ncbi:hypothetical protein AB0B01_10815 [Streptomyces sp. NPDC044571]|uniref:hypothetical protein n=1 Tax=Streptomyces sp. NPDC044571 TaxID=3155371 RepID=UPI0033E1A9CC
MSARGRLSAREAAAWNQLEWQLTAQPPRTGRLVPGARRPVPGTQAGPVPAAPMKRAVAALLLGAALAVLVTSALGGSTPVAVAAVMAWIGAVSAASAVFGHDPGARRRR